MARMLFPPGNWNQTVNTADTIVLEYTSSYQNVNLTLWCEQVTGTGTWIYWPIPGPLPANASYYLHLSAYEFADYINVWPTVCHFDLYNSKNKTQIGNGGRIPLNRVANAPDNTYSRAAATTSGGGTTLSTATLSITGADAIPKTGTGTTQTASATNPASTSDAAGTSSGLSSQAKLGVGIGVGLGGVILLVLAVWTLLLYRRRRQKTGQPFGSEHGKFEKAELLGSSLHPSPTPHYNELPAAVGGAVPLKDLKADRYSNTIRQSQWGPPQELASNHAQQTAYSPGQGTPQVQRYELGS